MSPWLKAGLIGAVVLIVINLLGLIPCAGCLTLPLGLLAYVGIGALAAYWMPPLRETGVAAGQGALAALVASVAGGVVNLIISVAQAALIRPGQVISQIPPETLQQLEQAGVDPHLFRQLIELSSGVGGAALCGSLCCAVGLLLAAALGAVGGAIFAAVKSD